MEMERWRGSYQPRDLSLTGPRSPILSRQPGPSAESGHPLR
jgi:hypothetical protein